MSTTTPPHRPHTARRGSSTSIPLSAGVTNVMTLLALRAWADPSDLIGWQASVVSTINRPISTPLERAIDPKRKSNRQTSRSHALGLCRGRASTTEIRLAVLRAATF
ncbi:hypothetical protein E1161_04820 [Saccharopolyspora aridisoli]|uniref:Uncharacterized protein n=1 Tax=Saccharopolyspora aridisoli TaxID=2530385 RepID=A0A4R4UTW3_9PSEU|nr:hypothetical protein E1161_04820 [Saccharopolyspora aridisoli]